LGHVPAALRIRPASAKVAAIAAAKNPAVAVVPVARDHGEAPSDGKPETYSLKKEY
jgi:hypothetical protein